MSVDITSTTTIDQIEAAQAARAREEFAPSRSMEQLIELAQRAAQQQSTKGSTDV
jgi:uncharacterized protein involved in propanediol utilization